MNSYLQLIEFSSSCFEMRDKFGILDKRRDNIIFRHLCSTLISKLLRSNYHAFDASAMMYCYSHANNFTVVVVVVVDFNLRALTKIFYSKVRKSFGL